MPAAGRPVLELSQLSVAIGGRTPVTGVDLTMHRGERLALIGASGSGKSLTARAVLGTLPRDARATGRVRVLGQDVLGRPVPRRPAEARVAAVAQDSMAALNPLVPVGRQLDLPLRARQGLRGAALGARRRELLAAVGFDDPAVIELRCAGELSGGQRQRVCIALALASRAALLVADEPTTALDLVTQHQVVDLLGQQTEDTALLFITHDIAVAASLCRRAVVFDGGRVVESAPMEQLVRAPQHPRTRDLVAAARRAAPVATGLQQAS